MEGKEPSASSLRQRGSRSTATDTELPPSSTPEHPLSNGSGSSSTPTKHSKERRGSLPGFYSHTYLTHTKIRASPFDKESPEQNYRGFLNLALLLLFVTNMRLVVENAQKYGLLLGSGDLGMSARDWVLAGLCLALMPLHLVAAVLIERQSSLTKLPASSSQDWRFICLHVLNITLEILIPTLVVWYQIQHPLAGISAIFLPTILFLKLISYVLVNKELKHEREDNIKRNQGINVPKSPRPDEDPAKDALAHAIEDTDHPVFEPQSVKYPDNITLNNIFYFWFAPTLCYQPVYPRTQRFRKSYFFKRLLELVSVGLTIAFLVRQYALPTLINATPAMKEASPSKLLERLLKLSVTSLYIWILGFYAFFHSFLSAFAEVLRFGDRRFFGEWWNSTSFAQYWREWNLPVSSWAKRHIYLPLIRNYSLSPLASQLVVFLVSALLHELIIGVPTHTLYGYAAMGMLLQVPMIWIDSLISKIREKLGWRPRKEIIDTIGNVHFWMSFCIVGQPLVVMLYWFDYQRKLQA